MYRAIVANAQQIADKCRTSLVWTSAAFTTSVGSTADLTLSTSYVYRAITSIRDTTYGRMLDRLSLDEINQMRQGVISTTGAMGIPRAYAIWEASDQTVTIRLDTVPSVAIAYDIAQRTVLAGVYTDAATLSFSEGLLRVIERATAMELMAGMLPEDQQRLKLNPKVMEAWGIYVRDGIILEQQRQANLSRRPFGVGLVYG
jgi:hypothetical protein